MEMISAPETKAAAGSPEDVTDAFGEFMTSFEAYKQENDLRLRQIETRSAADVLTTEKIERIDAALDRQKRTLEGLALKRARPALGEVRQAAEPDERKQAFEAYVRSGDDRLMRALDTKAMSYGSGQDGGYPARRNGLSFQLTASLRRNCPSSRCRDHLPVKNGEMEADRHPRGGHPLPVLHRERMPAGR